MRAAVLVALVLATGCAGSRLHEGRRELYVADDVAYREGSADPKHRLDLYAPTHGTGHPVVLFIHGGFWKGQARKYLPGRDHSDMILEIDSSPDELGARIAKFAESVTR